MADEPVKVNVQSRRVDSSILPNTFSQPYRLYIIQQNTDMLSIANAANNAGELAYEATVKNEEQDAILADHEGRITANTQAIQLLNARLTTAEGKINVLRNDVDFLIDEVSDIETTLANHETRITSNESRISYLEYATTRKKSEVIYTGLSLAIPTTATNLISLIKTLTPSSGTLAPFFDTVNNKMVVFNENKTLNFKLSIVGNWPGGTTNRSMQLTFSGAVPDTIVDSRNAATATNNILMATFFSVDVGGFLATNGSTLTIQSNGAVFTANTIKIIAEQ